MKVFTINSGSVSEGAEVQDVTIESAGFTFQAISVGEQGRGRKQATLPVDGRACVGSRETGRKVLNAEVGKTKSGKPKLFSERDSDNSKCVVVFRTKIGFRGGNSHTGDRKGIENEGEYNERLAFEEFPGEILAQGSIAQGTAGRMGGGSQLIAVMPKGVVFRTGYSGRLYGNPSAHYYVFDGEKIVAVTWEERIASDIF